MAEGMLELSEQIDTVRPMTETNAIERRCKMKNKIRNQMKEKIKARMNEKCYE